MIRFPIVILLVLGLTSCTGDEDPAPGQDSLTADAVVPDAISDTPQDINPEDAQIWEPPDTGFYAWTASRHLPVPLGFPTAGYGQSVSEEQPVSPFVDHFWATTEIHTRPGIKVLALHQGEQLLILAKMDLIGVFSGMVSAITKRVESETGIPVEDHLILAATHTHAGPGRFVEHILSSLIADAFDPEFYDALVETGAAAIIDALSNGVPAKFGYAITTNDQMHKDRRCENGDIQDDTLGVLRIDRADGSPLAVVINYAMHGTLLTYKDTTLSVDAPGIVEQKVEERFDAPVTALFFQSWGGDMAPENLVDLFLQQGPSANVREEYSRMEAIGESAADSVMDAWELIPVTDVVDLDIHHARVPFGLEAMGYEEGEWPHPSGASFCGGQQSECSDEVVPNMDICVPIPGAHTVWESKVSVARIGDLVLATLPGEPVTPLSLSYRDQVRESCGMEDVLIVGYAQDYTGYLLDSEDWAAGGYEGAGNFWGPKQGEHLVTWGAALAALSAGPPGPRPSPKTITFHGFA